jgi:hypothetical protein
VDEVFGTQFETLLTAARESAHTCDFALVTMLSQLWILELWALGGWELPAACWRLPSYESGQWDGLGLAPDERDLARQAASCNGRADSKARGDLYGGGGNG